MRLCVHIIVDNIMTCVFKSTVLNCKYLVTHYMNVFNSLVCCRNLCFLWFEYLTLGSYVTRRSQILPLNSSIFVSLRGYYYARFKKCGFNLLLSRRLLHEIV